MNVSRSNVFRTLIAGDVPFFYMENYFEGLTLCHVGVYPEAVKWSSPFYIFVVDWIPTELSWQVVEAQWYERSCCCVCAAAQLLTMISSSSSASHSSSTRHKNVVLFSIQENWTFRFLGFLIFYFLNRDWIANVTHANPLGACHRKTNQKLKLLSHRLTSGVLFFIIKIQ